MGQVLEWVSLVVAVVAAGVAFASWRASSRAATAAQQSADASLRSADVAEQAIEIEQDRLHREHKPKFAIDPTLEGDRFAEGKFRLHVVLTNCGHTDLDDVVVEVESSPAGGSGSPFIVEDRSRAESASLGIVGVGVSKAFYLSGGTVGESVTLLLRSTKEDRSWLTVESFGWPRRPYTGKVSTL